jgi:Icc-related predicted phosphoesterase
MRRMSRERSTHRTTRVAALCDVHGNLPALEAVLADVDASAVDAIVVGGDAHPTGG